jgi:hypothetical protein
MDKAQQGKCAEVAAQVPQAAMSVRAFCATHSISRSLFYLLRRRGCGPAILKAGSKTLVSFEAAEAWRRRLEANSEVR